MILAVCQLLLLDPLKTHQFNIISTLKQASFLPKKHASSLI